MVGIATTRYPPLVQGDEWIFPIAFTEADGTTPINGSGYTLTAQIDWYDDKIDIDELLDDENDDRTGILWVNQSQFTFKIKVNEDDTADVPANIVPRLIVYYVDTKGDRYTMLIQGLEVLTP